jgi:hypothetical protein
MKKRGSKLGAFWDSQARDIGSEADKLQKEYQEVYDNLPKDVPQKEKARKTEEILGKEWRNARRKVYLRFVGMWSAILLVIAIVILLLAGVTYLGSQQPVEVPNAPADWSVSDLVGGSK